MGKQFSLFGVILIMTIVATIQAGMFKSRRRMLEIVEPEDSDNNPVFNCLQSWHNYPRMTAHMWAGNLASWDLYIDFYQNIKRLNEVTCVDFNSLFRAMNSDCQVRVAQFFGEIFAISGPIIVWKFGTVRERLRASIKDAYEISIDCMPVNSTAPRFTYEDLFDINSLLE